MHRGAPRPDSLRRRTDGFRRTRCCRRQLRRARHDEQRVAILLDFRPLVGMVGVLDGEIVQVELPLHAAQQRHIRLVQSDPDHVSRPAAPVRGFIDRDIGNTPAVDVDAGRDDPIGANCRGRASGFGCQIHGFRPSMLAVEPCFEATFFDEASTTKPAVNAIELSAARTDRTTEPSQAQPAITRSASIRQAR